MSDGVAREESPYDALRTWAASHGAELHPNIKIAQDPATGAGFRVKNDLQVKPGDTVVTCPMSITLSYLNALPNPPPGFHQESEDARFPSEFLNEAPPHVISRFFLMKQYLLEKRSFWWPYIRALPQPEQLSSWFLPPFWPEEDLAYLDGTNLEVSVTEIKATLKNEFKEARRLLKGWQNWGDYTRVLYNWAYSIFTSRSFMPTLVVPNRSELDGSRVDWNSFSILLPLYDIGNHSMMAKTSWDINSETNSCSLITRDSYEAGSQVFNNYGMKTNAQLLLAYGFVIGESPSLQNDYVHVRKRVVPDANSASSSEQQKPLEYLFSLRPMMDPSSVIGRVFQSNFLDLEPTLFPAFKHVQASMVLDILEQILKNNESLSDPTIANTDEYLRRVLTADLPREKAQILQIILATIQQKALQELQKLEDSEPELPEEDGEEDLSENQKLALGFRQKCREVLYNVMDSIQESTEDERFLSLMGTDS